jgi:AraC-like DNA-binding protein
MVNPSWTGGSLKVLRIKKGIPGSIQFGPGIFFYKIIMNHANIKRALHFINKNLHRPLSLEVVSRESGMSMYHFARTFKAVTVITFKMNYNRLRKRTKPKSPTYISLKRLDIAFLLDY